jgi:ribosomal protein S6--L-glutamate ligase
MKILILSTSPKSEATQLFFKAALKRGHNPIIKNPDSLYLFISDSESGYDRVYCGEADEVERLKAKDYDAILPRIHSGINFGVPIVRHLNQNLGIYSTQSASGIRAASNKFETHQKLSIDGIKTPKTIFAKSPKHIKFLIEKIGDLPAIAKTVKGSLGLGVMILKDVEQTNSTMEALYHNQVETLLQAFVDGKSKDIRAIVCGDEVIASMERTGKKGDFRANVSRGGTGTKIELSDTDKALCIRAAKSINLEVAGVDLIKDAEGNSFIIEINAAFGMQIQEITGIDVAGKIIEHIEKNYKRKTAISGATAINLNAKGGEEIEEEGFFSRLTRLSNGG